VIDVLDLQRSQHGDGFFLNLGIYLRDLGKLVEPKIYECHLARRHEHEGRRADEVADEGLAWFLAHSSRRKIESLRDRGELHDIQLGRELDKLADLPPLPPLIAPAIAEPVVVQHPTFGRGTIVADLGQNVEVAFASGIKRLRRTFLEIVSDRGEDH
jgi:hypothetical protein